MQQDSEQCPVCVYNAVPKVPLYSPLAVHCRGCERNCTKVTGAMSKMFVRLQQEAEKQGKTDASGNPILKDIGLFLRAAFRKQIEVPSPPPPPPTLSLCSPLLGPLCVSSTHTLRISPPPPRTHTYSPSSPKPPYLPLPPPTPITVAPSLFSCPVSLGGLAWVASRETCRDLP